MSTRTPIEREVARILDDARIDLGLSQAEVSERAIAAGYDVKQEKVSRVLRGKTTMNLSDAQGIAAALGMRLSRILELVESEGMGQARTIDVSNDPRTGPAASGGSKRRPRPVSALPPEA